MSVLPVPSKSSSINISVSLVVLLNVYFLFGLVKNLAISIQSLLTSEQFLERSVGIESEIYIESLKFPGTIEFHQKRGFVKVENQGDLKRSVLMKKIL